MTLDNFPDADPSITLDFTKSKKLDPRITFTRASAAGPPPVVGEGSGNVNGQVYEFQENVPRLTSQGLLIEESRTNSCLHSEDVTVSPWLVSGATRTPNATTAPDGTSTADALFETSATGQHYLGYAVQPFQAIATSIFVKPNGRDNVALRVLVNGGNWVTAVFNLTGSGSMTQLTDNPTSGISYETSSIVAVGNGWYRISLATNYISSTNQYPILVSTCTSSTPTLGSFGAEEFAGDVAKGVYVWGAQFEYEKDFPTSYIPTSGAAVTRAPDNAQLNGVNVTSWYNPPKGTVYSEAMTPHDLTTSRYVWYFTSPGRKEHNADDSFQWFDAGYGTTSGTTYVGGTINKQAYSYGNVVPGRPCLNGNLEAQFIANTSPPAHTALSLGSNFGVNLFFNGYIQRFAYYPILVPDDSLQALTTQQT